MTLRICLLAMFLTGSVTVPCRAATTAAAAPAAATTPSGLDLAPSLIECTVVRAYPDTNGNPDPTIHDHAYQIGEPINLDVRGLGAWFRDLAALDAESKTVQDLIGKTSPTENEKDYSQWITAVRTSAKTLCLYIDGKPLNDLEPLTVNPQWWQNDQYDRTNCPLMTLRFILHRCTTEKFPFGLRRPDPSTSSGRGSLSHTS
jgi:hypothetical protein